MNRRREREEAIDALIEAALRDEPMRPTPITLQRRVEQRIRIASLRDRERTRFRYTMASLAVGFCALIAMGVAVVAVTNLNVLLANGVSGGLGTYDSYINSLALSWTSYTGAYSLSASVFLAAGTLLLALIPLGRYIASH